jgi:hypothetical protein
MPARVGPSVGSAIVLLREDLLVGVFEIPRNPIPVEHGADEGAASFTDRLPSIGFLDRLVEGVEVTLLPGSDPTGVMFLDVGVDVDAGCDDDGQLGVHGFGDGDPEVLLVGGEDEHVGSAAGPQLVLAAHEPEEADGVPEIVLVDDPSQFGFVVVGTGASD